MADVPEQHQGGHAPKPVELALTWHAIKRKYVVVSISNSAWFLPGEEIDQEVVRKLEDPKLYPNWTFKAVNFDYWAQLIGPLLGAAGQAGIGIPIPKL